MFTPRPKCSQRGSEKMAAGSCICFYHRLLMWELASHSNGNCRLKQTCCHAKLRRMLPRGRRYYSALCKIHSSIQNLSVHGFMWFFHICHRHQLRAGFLTLPLYLHMLECVCMCTHFTNIQLRDKLWLIDFYWQKSLPV